MQAANIALFRGVRRKTLFEIWKNERNYKLKSQSVITFIENRSDCKNYTEHVQNKIRKIVKNFCSQLLQKWKKSSRNKNRFKLKNRLWLEGTLLFLDLPLPSGRPMKTFADSSEAVKRRKVQALLAKHSEEELSYATRMSLRLKGKRDAAEILKQVSCFSPKRATRIKKSFFSSQSMPKKISHNEALAHYIDTRMTKRQYIAVQKISKRHNADIFPNYNKLLVAKKLCYPSDITLTEDCAVVKLQSLIDHTTKRLFEAQNEVVEQVIQNNSKFSLFFKWGCDGAAAQSRYKQVFANVDHDDTYMFSICLVPLKLSDNNLKVLWQNRATSSVNFCRPIKIIFQKENEQFVKTEVEQVKQQIDNLQLTTMNINGKKISCKAVLFLTMIDGKICSWLTDTSGQNCHVCGAKPKIMNDINAVLQRPINEKNLSFGISSLHAWIKTMEFLLHVAYRLKIKKWQIKQIDKASVIIRKKNIQNQFRQKMGLLIDIPKPGFGTSNDGNTARRFFSNPELSSQITGVNQELIYRLDVILRTLASGYEVDTTLFEPYCLDTYKLYVREYPWYYMPQSVHKMLLHGSKIINTCVLPIGQMSEEAQESRNKDNRRYREYHSRKFSRLSTLEDVFHMLLISSDPLISSIRNKNPKKTKPFPKDVKNMLKGPDLPTIIIEDDLLSDDSDDT